MAAREKGNPIPQKVSEMIHQIFIGGDWVEATLTGEQFKFPGNPEMYYFCELNTPEGEYKGVWRRRSDIFRVSVI